MPDINRPIAIAKAISERDNDALLEATQGMTAQDALFADDALSTKEGRSHIAKILEGELDGPAIRGALAATAPDMNAFQLMAAGTAIGSLAACIDDPRLLMRATEVAQSMIEKLPARVAEAVHARAVFSLAMVSKLQPSAASAVENVVYPALARSCHERGNYVSDGLFDPSRDQRLTPGGAAILCNFAPAVKLLAAIVPDRMLQERFKSLEASVAPVFLENVREAKATATAIAEESRERQRAGAPRSDQAPRRERGAQSLSH